jgi:class 3 adenylate cyclase
MGKLPDDFYRSLFGLPPDLPAETDPLGGLYGINKPSFQKRFFEQLSSIPPPPKARGLSGFSGLSSIAPPPAPPKTPFEPGIAWARLAVGTLLKRNATVSAGRVLPGIEDLAVMEGRRVRAAFVYSDLHGFTKLVATQPENKSFVFLDTFVHVASKLTSYYSGQVMDCAGDRVLSVFQRQPSNLSNEPVEDAVTFALWLQTVFNKVIGPAFGTKDGLGQLSLGIGIDYGEAVVGCVGIRSNKRIVFFGDAANYAAKLQEIAGAGETVLSPDADARKPPYLNNGTWDVRRERLSDGKIILRTTNIFADDKPLKVR